MSHGQTRAVSCRIHPQQQHGSPDCISERHPRTVYHRFSDMLELLPNDRVKRISDGKVFRITSDARDMTTPEQSDMHFREADAEVVTT